MRFEKYLKEMDFVDGWLSRSTAVISHELMNYQADICIRGNVCEIGVHHGKYFLALATGLADGEKAVAIDLFENQKENIDRSGAGDRNIFTSNIDRYFDPSATIIITGNSTKLSAASIIKHGFVRFFSIDGGHTEGITDNDLRLAEASLCEGGIVALDDIFNYNFCGVVSGLAKYKYNGGKLIPLALIPNKLLLTDAGSVSRFRTFMRAQCADFLGKPDLEMMSGIVDFFLDRHDIVGEPAKQDVGEDFRQELERIKSSKRYKVASMIANYYNRIIGRL